MKFNIQYLILYITYNLCKFISLIFSALWDWDIATYQHFSKISDGIYMKTDVEQWKFYIVYVYFLRWKFNNQYFQQFSLISHFCKISWKNLLHIKMTWYKNGWCPYSFNFQMYTNIWKHTHTHTHTHTNTHTCALTYTISKLQSKCISGFVI